MFVSKLITLLLIAGFALSVNAMPIDNNNKVLSKSSVVTTSVGQTFTPNTPPVVTNQQSQTPPSQAVSVAEPQPLSLLIMSLLMFLGIRKFSNKN